MDHRREGSTVSRDCRRGGAFFSFRFVKTEEDCLREAEFWGAVKSQGKWPADGCAVRNRR